MPTWRSASSIAYDSACRKELEIRTHFERPARAPIWIFGISICLLTASGIVAIVRSIPASYASIPDEAALVEHGAAPSGSDYAHTEDPQAHFTVARTTTNRRKRLQCAECGVIESTAQIERSREGGGQGAVKGKAAADVTGGKIAANAITGKGYALKVRFRDGSTTVFNEASPRSWPSGSRVVVIGGLNPSTN